MVYIWLNLRGVDRPEVHHRELAQFLTSWDLSFFLLWLLAFSPHALASDDWMPCLDEILVLVVLLLAANYLFSIKYFGHCLYLCVVMPKTKLFRLFN